MEQLQLYFRTSLLTSGSIQVSFGGAFKGFNMFTCLPRSLGKMIQSWLQPPTRKIIIDPIKSKTSPPSRRYVLPFVFPWRLDEKMTHRALGCFVLSMISIETDTISWHDPSDLTSILVNVYVALKFGLELRNMKGLSDFRFAHIF